jgi:hypothetical protein
MIKSIEKRKDLSIIPYPYKGDFNIFKIKGFRKIKVDLLILPFNNESGAGYLNAIIFSFGIRAKRRISCNREGNFRLMGYGYLMKRLAVGAISSIFGIFGVVVFGLPVLLMISLYGIRRNGSKESS